MTFPVDYNQWGREWIAWKRKNRLNRVSKVIPGQNLLADEILGTYEVITEKGGKLKVELSAVTFPDFGSHGDGRVRYVGITWWRNGENVNGGLVDSFAELEEKLREGV